MFKEGFTHTRDGGASRTLEPLERPFVGRAGIGALFANPAGAVFAVGSAGLFVRQP